jgi:hypothetical protein
MAAVPFAAVALSTILAAPAMAATGPSMIQNGNSVNIAAQGPDHTLRFYWAVNGTATWHPETVAGPGTTYSAPSMIQNGNSVNITAQGPAATLRFYWAVNGTATWHPETVGTI